MKKERTGKKDKSNKHSVLNLKIKKKTETKKLNDVAFFCTINKICSGENHRQEAPAKNHPQEP